MNKYKIYFYDRKLKSEYPLTVYKKDMNDLCRWLNHHTFEWGIDAIGGFLLDALDGYKSKIHFLQCEIDSQYFISDYYERLVTYHELEGD